MLILAGDIGGTSTRLAYFEATDGKLETVAEARFSSREAGSLDEIVDRFSGQHGLQAERASFGIAGPVRRGQVRTPNLPWSVDAGRLANALGLADVLLVNDLEANAYGIAMLVPQDFAVLNAGTPDPAGTLAVVSAGTGLGEVLAYWDGSVHRPLPSEGGHADFAARNELEAQLLLYLRAEHGRVSVERVVSGPGLYNIYRFLRETGDLAETAAVAVDIRQSDPSAAIATAALTGQCPLCDKALDLFVSLYGAEAGNVALRALSSGGLYLGGGIAPKIIERLKGPGFMQAFTAKGRLSPLLETIPVRVILNDRTALLGAARCAAIGRMGKP